ncbi:MAG TPA: hypothetical protein VIV56_14655 [Gemmatimonadales bacterium]
MLRIRLLRTRLGLWLVLVVAALLWIERAAPRSDPLTTTLQAGTLSAVLCVGYLVGSGADRAALLLPLLHPTTPGALVLGRWAAATGGAALAVLAIAAHAAWTTGAVAPSLSAALAGFAAAAAVASCTLALVLAGGNVLATLFFVWLALVGSAPPETLIDVPHPGSIRVALAAILELAPAPWRYRAISTGDPGALLHAAAWVALGLATARRLMGRFPPAAR